MANCSQTTGLAELLSVCWNLLSESYFLSLTALSRKEVYFIFHVCIVDFAVLFKLTGEEFFCLYWMTLTWPAASGQVH